MNFNIQNEYQQEVNKISDICRNKEKDPTFFNERPNYQKCLVRQFRQKINCNEKILNEVISSINFDSSCPSQDTKSIYSENDYANCEYLDEYSELKRKYPYATRNLKKAINKNMNQKINVFNHGCRSQKEYGRDLPGFFEDVRCAKNLVVSYCKSDIDCEKDFFDNKDIMGKCVPSEYSNQFSHKQEMMPNKFNELISDIAYNWKSGNRSELPVNLKFNFNSKNDEDEDLDQRENGNSGKDILDQKIEDSRSGINDGMRRSEESIERQKMADERKRAEDERQRLEDERKRAEESIERQRLEEESKRAEESIERQKMADDRKRAEDERQRLEDEKRRSEESIERQRLEDERKRLEEDSKRSEDDRKRLEEDSKRSEDDRKRAEELIERQRLEDERKRAEEERQRVTDNKAYSGKDIENKVGRRIFNKKNNTELSNTPLSSTQRNKLTNFIPTEKNAAVFNDTFYPAHNGTLLNFINKTDIQNPMAGPVNSCSTNQNGFMIFSGIQVIFFIICFCQVYLHKKRFKGNNIILSIILIILGIILSSYGISRI